MISGSFRINFTEPNYLWMALEAANRHGSQKEGAKTQETGSKNPFDTRISFKEDKRANLNKFLNGGQKGIEELIQKFTTPKQFSTRNTELRNHTPFNIVIGYGYDSTGESIGERLNQVSIIGDGKAIEITGQPLQEEYQFIARSKR